MVRTDSVSCTVAVFVISHKNKSFSEIILKNGLSRWLHKWEGKIFMENTLTKPHFCRDRWRDNIPRHFVEFHINKLFPETCKKSACFVGSIYEGICAGFMKLRKYWGTPFISPILDAYHLRGFLGSFHENEIIFKISYILALLDAYQVRGYLSSLHEKYLKACKLLAYFNAYHMRGISGPKIFFAKHPHKTPFSPR